MKLKPTQIVGLIAIVVFGGGMIFRMTQPSEREIMEQRLASLPRVTAPEVEFPIPDLSAIVPPSSTLDTGKTAASPAIPDPYAKDYLAIGSQDAKDDLYCAGALTAEFDVKIETEHPDKVVPLLEQQKSLDTAGIAKLKAEGLSTGEDWAYFTGAYSDKAAADYKAGALRIPVAACVARAAKLPPGSLY